MESRHSMEVNPSHNFASALFPEKESFWKFRTRFEKLLLIVIIVVIILCAALCVLIAVLITNALNSKGIDSNQNDCDLANAIGFNYDKSLFDYNASKVCLTPGCVKAGQSPLFVRLIFALLPLPLQPIKTKELSDITFHFVNKTFELGVSAQCGRSWRCTRASSVY